jgi:cytochrome P450
MVVAEAAVTEKRVHPLRGEAPPSPAGPAGEEDQRLPTPPEIPLPRLLQSVRFSYRQIEFVFKARRKLGEVFRMAAVIPGRPVITSHPDHVRSIFTAKVEHVPTLTAESPLRPVVGPNSVLTAQAPRHMRQRKLLLPHFHGEAIEQYRRMIEETAEREIDRWRVGKTIVLASRMQAITLDVIMAGIFGIEGRPAVGTPEHGLRVATRELLRGSTQPTYQVVELMNLTSTEAIGVTKVAVGILDRFAFGVIRARRRAADLGERRDILSMLLQARTEEGEALSDQEVRDELLTLVLAGHETTANQLAWAWERLLRTPDAHERLREAVRNGDEDERLAVIDGVIYESMRSRPVIPIVGRRVTVPWRLGDYAVPAGTPISLSVLLVHHREDLYPDPFSFRPERWEGGKPGTYEWIPFGGGTRRCLGAALAMAEMQVVLEAMTRRVDLEADRPEPEHALHRNVTMIPARGARARVTARG